MDNHDVLLLTLHKQHYLDHYEGIKIGNYSCLGYYDAISIKTMDGITRGSLTEKKGNAPFSDLWYATGMQVKSQKGGYSNQNIGLFRNIPDGQEGGWTDEYWRQEGDLPYFAMGFLKLCEITNLNDTRKKIENFRCTRDRGRGLFNCLVITYDTLDNADLVVFLKGNSLTFIHSVFERIEELEEVVYLHSIIGVEERYLTECKDQGEVLDSWRGFSCCIDEPIERICFSLASVGGSQVLSDIKAQWELNNRVFPITGYENTTYSYVSGHGNIVITLERTDVRSLLSLMLPDGFMTHGNPVYSRNLYNIETDIIIQKKAWNEIKAKEGNDETGNEIGKWCINNIEKYCGMLDQWCQNKDEGMYSYYQALIQTLSMLDQYERFKMSRDIFLLIYPSFKMLDGQLKAVIDRNIDVANDALQIENIKRELNEYLECVNSVIYHTIHTDQIYLMIPGYSGTSFSIPIKYSLFYMWFTKTIADILNDNQRQYSCILTPGMESKATTCMIVANEIENNNKIISLKLSQRHLYFPQNIMIILCHELGHYIGRGIRCRKKRMECISRSLAGYIAEGIFPEWFEITVENEKIIKWYREHLNMKLQLMITELMYTHMKERCPDDCYHAQDIRDAFLEFSLELLSDVGSGVQIAELTKDLPEDLLKIVESDSEKYGSNMRDIYQIQRQIERNVRILSSSRVMDIIIDDIIEIFQEVFSDIAAFSILKYGQEDFEEAFRVSEGMAASVESKQHRMRREVINRFINGGQVEQTSPVEAEDNGNTNVERDNLELYLMNRTYEFAFLYENLVNYAKTCYDEINARLVNFQDKIQRIRDVYGMFVSEKNTMGEIYDDMMKCIEEYRISTWEEYLVEELKNS